MRKRSRFFLNAALAISGHRNVNEFWILQIEVVHDQTEFLAGFTRYARIECALLSDATYPSAAVIVSWIYQRFVRQGKKPLHNAVVLGSRIAALKISSAAAVNHQGVAGEHAIVNQV